MAALFFVVGALIAAILLVLFVNRTQMRRLEQAGWSIGKAVETHAADDLSVGIADFNRGCAFGLRARIAIGMALDQAGQTTATVTMEQVQQQARAMLDAEAANVGIKVEWKP